AHLLPDGEGPNGLSGGAGPAAVLCAGWRGGVPMKYVRRLTPVQYYDVAGAESWLADMARRGLHLKKFRPLYCTFEQGEPREVRYRLEPHQRRLDDDLPQGMLELYEEFGWEYVDETNRSILIFRTADPSAPEPHSDPELQAKGWQ